MTWQTPGAFLLLLALILVFIWNRWRREKKEASVQFSSLQGIKTARPGLRAQLRLLPEVLKILALVFAVIALARPREGNTKVRKNVEGIDIIICMDISDSMLIEDMKPLNRLESAKETLKKFVERRSSDRIGLVVFAGESFTMVPPTLDYQMLTGRVDEITTAKDARIKD